MSISKGLMHLSILQRKTCWTTLEGIFVVLANIARMRSDIIQMILWGDIWSSMDSWRIIDVGINMGRRELIK
jgi:hypothetical protein